MLFLRKVISSKPHLKNLRKLCSKENSLTATVCIRSIHTKDVLKTNNEVKDEAQLLADKDAKCANNRKEEVTNSEELKNSVHYHNYNLNREDGNEDYTKITEEIGEDTFEKNQEILKTLMFRGIRALAIAFVGIMTLAITTKYKKGKNELAVEEQTDETDPTQRYLQEMRELGFDVDTLEDELREERKQKQIHTEMKEEEQKAENEVSAREK